MLDLCFPFLDSYLFNLLINFFILTYKKFFNWIMKTFYLSSVNVHKDEEVQ